ncbi:hypothetical protein H920_09021 [Fukomys damarensis]|uniref:Uncharacterized protein n=1 Tax=Fukomys damarensis TaxID=885580 RepID=A0A091DEU0_FUKDA|nr:hypothetical protein H920_09021 [Fukomys damarensis]
MPFPLFLKLGWKFYDADDFHPEENRVKMGKGMPLTDQYAALHTLSFRIWMKTLHAKAEVACTQVAVPVTISTAQRLQDGCVKDQLGVPDYYQDAHFGHLLNNVLLHKLQIQHQTGSLVAKAATA